MIFRTIWTSKQKQACIKFDAEFTPCEKGSKIALHRNTRSDIEPITGIRHLPDRGLNGWFIWAGGGEVTSLNQDLFDALHVEHMPKWCPTAVPYLSLPPGWGFIIADGYEDVWFDENYLID